MVRELGREARPDLLWDTEHSCPHQCLSAGPAAPLHFSIPWHPACSCGLLPLPQPPPSKPHVSIYHLIGFPPFGQLVTTLLWVTTFPGSGAATLSASKLHWLLESHTPCFCRYRTLVCPWQHTPWHMALPAPSPPDIPCKPSVLSPPDDL